MDPTLVVRARRGDVQAFDRIVALRLDSVYRITLGITGNAADASDATQDAFIAAWRGLTGLRDPERFDAWMTTIVVNASRLQIRRRNRVREIQRAVSSQPSHQPDVLDHDALSLIEGISRLPLDQRVVIALHHLDDQPVEQVAARLHIPVGTVKSRLHTGRAMLRTLLDERTP